MSTYKPELIDPNSTALQTNTTIAAEISLLAGILYSGIYFFCKYNESVDNKEMFIDGRWWMFQSTRALAEKYYKFATEKQIIVALKKLEGAGYITKRKDSGVRNNTSLYSISKDTD